MYLFFCVGITATILKQVFVKTRHRFDSDYNSILQQQPLKLVHIHRFFIAQFCLKFFFNKLNIYSIYTISKLALRWSIELRSGGRIHYSRWIIWHLFISIYLLVCLVSLSAYYRPQMTFILQPTIILQPPMYKYMLANMGRIYVRFCMRSISTYLCYGSP